MKRPVTLPFTHVVAFLVAGNINHHLLTHEGECDMRCCPECCAPCKALSVFKTDGGQADWLRCAFEAWDTNWDWLDEAGYIRWDLIEAHWFPGPCQEGCERNG